MLFLPLFLYLYSRIQYLFHQLLPKLLHKLFTLSAQKTHFRKVQKKQQANNTSFNKSHFRNRKPEWVFKEVLRLKAFMPNAGCRTIATTFNRIHMNKSGMTVSKSYCADKIKRNNYEIQVLRRKIRNRKPRYLDRNIVWATDLTTVTDSHKNQHKLLGIIDHGTRACLKLQQLPTVTSITILRCLIDAIEAYGKPKVLRTDNERIFTSRLFRFSLFILGIKHQRTQTYCPWQNGRIERFFGTFKPLIKQVMIESAEQLQSMLPTYRFWYNHVRPHDNLAGYTPAETWTGNGPRKDKKSIPVSEWSGVLKGYYLRR